MTTVINFYTMKKLVFISQVLGLVSIAALGQEIQFETSIISNSVALHPMIIDVQKDGRNDIVVIDDYVDGDGNDALNLKKVVWFSEQGKSGGDGFKENPIAELKYRSCVLLPPTSTMMAISISLAVKTLTEMT